VEEVNALKYKQESLVAKVLRKLRKKPIPLSNYYYKEPHYNFDANVYDSKGASYFEGYWQSEKYFLEYREQLLQEFILKKELSNQSKAYRKKILSTASISLHIRRGDYVTNAHTNSVHGTCSMIYYRTSVEEIKSQIIDAHFFIFSDDLVWAKENLNSIENITFIDLAKDVPDHEEMILMSLCKHNIIANSSFSWWGAWLNQNNKKIVIAPKQWFTDTSINTNDLIPSSWTRL